MSKKRQQTHGKVSKWGHRGRRARGRGRTGGQTRAVPARRKATAAAKRAGGNKPAADVPEPSKAKPAPPVAPEAKPPAKPIRGPGQTGEAGQETRWPIYDSLAQCSADSGWPLTVLRESKAAGCPAFHSGRVYFGKLAEWWFAKFLDDPYTDWARDFEKSRAMRERIKLKADEDRIIDFAEVDQFLARYVASVYEKLHRIFCTELPTVLHGLGVNAIKLRCGEEIERMKRELKDELQSWKESKPAESEIEKP